MSTEHERGNQCDDWCITNYKDLYESMDMILTAHHPTIRDKVMGMWGDAIGNNADTHLTFDCDLFAGRMTSRRLREQAKKLIEYAEKVRRDITDQDTGWYYQLGNHIEKMNRMVKE